MGMRPELRPLLVRSIEGRTNSDVEFRDAENAELIVGRKPDRRRGSFRNLKAAEEKLGIPVCRSVAN